MGKEVGETKKVVCILSGGIDSTSVAAYWRNKEYKLYLLTFNYGQRAKKEIERAKEIAGYLEAKEHKIVDISFMRDLYGESNVLTSETKEIPAQFQANLIVPIRNAIFLTIATAWAYSIGAKMVAYGAHMTDKPYPDCRREFILSLQEALKLGHIDAIKNEEAQEVKIWSPLMANLEKYQLLKIGYKILGDRIFRTWSCYESGEKHCGRCESCNNRKKAFQLAGIQDKTEYEA